MVGRVTAERLQKAGITTIGRLAATDIKMLRSLMGAKAVNSFTIRLTE